MINHKNAAEKSKEEKQTNKKTNNNNLKDKNKIKYQENLTHDNQGTTVNFHAPKIQINFSTCSHCITGDDYSTVPLILDWNEKQKLHFC